eukprot:scaffold886_cov249-Pinguiococcus_pyrenoidosus.AAC.6
MSKRCHLADIDVPAGQQRLARAAHDPPRPQLQRVHLKPRCAGIISHHHARHGRSTAVPAAQRVPHRRADEDAPNFIIIRRRHVAEGRRRQDLRGARHIRVALTVLKGLGSPQQRENVIFVGGLLFVPALLLYTFARVVVLLLPAPATKEVFAYLVEQHVPPEPGTLLLRPIVRVSPIAGKLLCRVWTKPKSPSDVSPQHDVLGTTLRQRTFATDDDLSVVDGAHFRAGGAVDADCLAPLEPPPHTQGIPHIPFPRRRPCLPPGDKYRAHDLLLLLHRNRTDAKDRPTEEAHRPEPVQHEVLLLRPLLEPLASYTTPKVFVLDCRLHQPSEALLMRRARGALAEKALARRRLHRGVGRRLDLLRLRHCGMAQHFLDVLAGYARESPAVEQSERQADVAFIVACC